MNEMNSDNTQQCNQTDLLITRYLSGSASPEEIEELLEWIGQDDENRRYFLRQQDIWTALNPAIDINEVNTADAEQKVLIRTGIIRHTLLRKFLVFWSRIAAVAIIPLLAVTLYLFYNPSDNDSTETVTMTTAFGCISNATLPDGTTVWLNANSSLQYNPTMNGPVRNVFLEGEAYFDVRSDAAHPFNVNTPYMTVTATGTEFNVNAYDSIASVTLVKGLVNVRTAGTDTALDSGEHLTVTDGRPVICRHIDTDRYCSWRNGILIFEEEPLKDICTRLQQIYDIEFEIAPELENRTFRMILNGENISEILRLFELSAPVVCEIRNTGSDNSNPKTKQHIRIMPS